MSGQVRAVLFDVDGTLVDSNYLHVQAWGDALVEVNHPAPSWRVHRAIGMDSHELLERMLGDDADELGERTSALHGRYFADLADRLRAFAGARDLLRALHSRGISVVLATSAPESELARLREVLDAEDAISAVTSSADVERAKPRPDVVRAALSKADVGPEDAVLVGDAVWDGVAARRAAVDFIGLRSGGIGGDELTDAGATAIYDDPYDLLINLDSSVIVGADSRNRVDDSSEVTDEGSHDASRTEV